MSKPDRTFDAEAPHSLPASWERDATTRLERPKARKDWFALYSRYSTAGQKATSIERQVELTREYVLRAGGTVVRSFVDEARSSMAASRAGLDAMMEAAARREFGVLVVENVDRLARDLSILATVFRSLERLGIEMHDPSRGRLAIQDIAFQGLMGEQGRRLLLERTSFSRIQMAREGRVPFGHCYGYLKVPGQPGELTIDPDQSEVVRLVFRLFLEGLSPSAIARVLARRSIVPLGRRDGWTFESVKRILRNPLYRGTLVYNRHAYTTDPQTKAKTREQRPREEWVVRPLPHLRIVPTEAWDRVQARLLATGRAGKGRGGKGRTCLSLLSQRLRCPRCSRTMHIAGFTGSLRYYKCSGFIAGATCKEHRGIRVEQIERAVVEAVGRHLLEEGFVDAYVAAYNEARVELDREHAGTRAELVRQVAATRRRLLDTFDVALTRGFTTGTLAAMRGDMEKELATAEAALSALPPPPVWATVDGKRMTGLAEAIAGIAASTAIPTDDEAGMRFAGTFREIVERVDLGPMDSPTVGFSVALRMSSLCGVAGMASPRLDPLVIEGRADKAPPRRRTAYATTGRLQADIRRDAAGEVAPCGPAYEAVAAIVRSEERFRLPDHTPLDSRLLAEVLVMIGLTGMPWGALPERFGRYTGWRLRFLVLVDDGTLGTLLARLREIDGVRYGDAFVRRIGMKLRGRKLVVRSG